MRRRLGNGGGWRRTSDSCGRSDGGLGFEEGFGVSVTVVEDLVLWGCAVMNNKGLKCDGLCFCDGDDSC